MITAAVANELDSNYDWKHDLAEWKGIEVYMQVNATNSFAEAYSYRIDAFDLILIFACWYSDVRNTGS